jgi:hypothetical protein
MSLVITGIIAVSATVSDAQSPVQKRWPRSAAVSNPIQVAPDQAVQTSQVATKQARAKAGKKAIVGSWLVEGIPGIVASFTSDGIVIGSGQGDISLSPDLPSLTGQHGAWTYLGGRQFAFSLVTVQYDVPTGEYRGLIRINGEVTVNEAGDRYSSMVQVKVFDAGGSLLDTFSFPSEAARIDVERIE